MTKIDVLDKGHVRLYKVFGEEIDIANAARISFNKETDVYREVDAKLVRYLARNGELSPFRHVFVSIVVKAPIIVCRQWSKYRVGSAHTGGTEGLLGEAVAPDDEDTYDLMQARSEVSRRYVTLPPEFYIPVEWRNAPKNMKQGSQGVNEGSEELTANLEALTQGSLALYDAVLAQGVCAEQARLFLPYAALYTEWKWTVSLDGLCHFLRQRLGHGAQSEIRDYAQAVRELVEPHFPNVIELLVDNAPMNQVRKLQASNEALEGVLHEKENEVKALRQQLAFVNEGRG